MSSQQAWARGHLSLRNSIHPALGGQTRGTVSLGGPGPHPCHTHTAKTQGVEGVEEEQDADAETPPRDRSHHRQLTPCDMFLKTRYLQRQIHMSLIHGSSGTQGIGSSPSA